MMAYGILNDHMSGCTNLHPSLWETGIFKCRSTLSNDKKGRDSSNEIHHECELYRQSEITDLMSVNGICKLNTSLGVYV